jgi:hypothetical protein
MRTGYYHYVDYGLYWLLENSTLLIRPNPYSEHYSAEKNLVWHVQVSNEYGESKVKY